MFLVWIFKIARLGLLKINYWWKCIKCQANYCLVQMSGLLFGSLQMFHWMWAFSISDLTTHSFGINKQCDWRLIHSRIGALPSIKSSRVWARFWIRPRQFFTFDVVAAWVVVVVVVGAVVVRRLFNWLLFISSSCRLFACDSINAWSSSKSPVCFFFVQSIRIHILGQ